MNRTRPVVIYPPADDGGRRVRINDHFVGIAYTPTDIAAFIQEAGLQSFDAVDVVRSQLIEWRGGGPSPAPWTKA
ncbi:hypothetical protein ABVB69_37710 [Streptomyces sp. NPDC000349]|uniref:hypothetical protein n=1 Tax=Streptomyces sp. NPDC000349 TaxID=3154249 RepID=UPI003369DEE1